MAERSELLIAYLDCKDGDILVLRVLHGKRIGGSSAPSWASLGIRYRNAALARGRHSAHRRKIHLTSVGKARLPQGTEQQSAVLDA